MTPHDDEFYIGYEPGLPSGIRARLKTTGKVMSAVLVAGALVVLLAHPRLTPSRFDFGRPHDAVGLLARRPYPSLTVDGQVIWLVGQGKHGAEATLAEVADGPVRMRGATIARDSHLMLELVPGSVASASPAPNAPPPQERSETPPGLAEGGSRDVTLVGEIVDSKCFLGVMNPGDSPVHRDCASLCLRGGIPPMLLVRDHDGVDALALLVGGDGGPMSAALASLAGVPVEVRGRLTRDDRGLVLAADVGNYRRLGRTSGPQARRRQGEP